MSEIRKLYAELEPDLYAQKEKFGLKPLRRFFHRSRQRIVNRVVQAVYRKGMAIYDLGCGTTNWNLSRLPAIGVDINKKMLGYAKRKGRISKYIISDITELELESGSTDIIILMDILEHARNYEKLIQKIRCFFKTRWVAFDQCSLRYAGQFMETFNQFNVLY